MNRFVLMGITLALMAMVTSSALALWSDTLRINVTVKTGDHDPGIGSYKVFKCVEHCCTDHCNGNDHDNGHKHGAEDDEVSLYWDRLELSLDLKSNNTTIWVGMVLENKGTLPSKLVSLRLIGLPGNISVGSVHVYGPYSHGGFAQEVWAHEDCSSLPPNGGGGLGVGFDPGEKLVVWIEFQVSDINGTLDFTVKPVFVPDL